MKIKVNSSGLSKYYRNYEGNVFDLILEAWNEAISNATVLPEVLIIPYLYGYTKQRNLKGHILDYLGLPYIPTFEIGTDCNAFVEALVLAKSLLKDFKTVGILSVHKFSEVKSDLYYEYMKQTTDISLEYPRYNPSAYYATFCKLYENKYNVKHEHIAYVAVKNYKHGLSCEKALYGHAYTLEDILNSEIVFEPLHILERCRRADASACLILERVDTPKIGDIVVIDALALTCSAKYGKDFTFSFLELLAKDYYNITDTKSTDYSSFQTDTAYTIAEILSLEALGVFDKGQAWKGAIEGLTWNTGIIPTNTNGGFIGMGHTIVTNGGMQIYEAIRQLRIRGGKALVSSYGFGNVGIVGMELVE